MALLPQARTWTAFGTKPSVGLLNFGATRGTQTVNVAAMPAISGTVPMAPLMAVAAPSQPQSSLMAPSQMPLLHVTGNPKHMVVSKEPTLTPAERNKAIMEANKKEASLPRLTVTKSMISMYTHAQKIAIAGAIRISSSELIGPGTINDSRMGVIGVNMRCGYCGQIDCPSHYGLTKLPYPIYNPIGIRTIISVLQVVCNCCGRLLIPEGVIKNNKTSRLRFDRRLANLEVQSKDHSCLRERMPGVPVCKPNPGYDVTKEIIKKGVIRKIVPEDGKVTAKSRKEGTRVECNIFEIIAILNSISDHDAELMGFSQANPAKINGFSVAVSHPRDLIMLYILIPPPIVRPHIYVGGTFRNDVLTTAYQSLIKKVAEIASAGVKIDSTGRMQMTDCQNSIMSPAEYANMTKVIELSKELYAMLYSILIDSSKAKFGHGMNKMESIANKFKGKGGIGRMNGQGKRVNYAARTVLGPEVSLGSDEIGIPEEFAPVLARPVKANRYNTAYLTGLMEQGFVQYITPVRTGLRRGYRKGDIYQLKIGDVIERWLMDGDWMMFNRQPTLHKQSMLAGRTRRRKHKTIGLPLPYCGAMNADFDGDEGNCWPPQYIETMVEARFIYNMTLNLMSSERNCPMMALTMNSVTASYLLTAGNVIVNESLFREIVGNLSNTEDLATLSVRLRRYGINPRSGEALFSALLPADFYYNNKGVVIVEGIIVKGQLKKTHVGTSVRSIVQDIHKRYRSARTALFISDATKLTCKWLIERGFTVGLADIINPEETEDGRVVVGNAAVVKKALARIYIQVESLGGPVDDPVEESYRRRQRSNILNSAQGIGLQLAKEVFSQSGNNIGIMSDYGSGAKGGVGNIGQMSGCVSQQYYRGEPLKPSISGERRLLPNFDLDDFSPPANAFIENSFYTGLEPEEFFFLMQGAREGILDTTLNTPKTGSMHHLMGKGNENLVVGHDGSVRNTIGTIFSTSYGLGFDVSEMLTVAYQTKENVTSFMDVQQVCDTLNLEAGWIPAELYETTQERLARLEAFEDQFLHQPTMSPVVTTEEYPPVVLQTTAPDLPIEHTKYEYARIIGSRANQIANDAVIRIPVDGFTPQDLADPVEVAYREYHSGALPDFCSIRKYPNGDFMEAVFYDGTQAQRGQLVV